MSDFTINYFNSLHMHAPDHMISMAATKMLVPIYQTTLRLCFIPVCFTPFWFNIFRLLYVLLFKSYFLAGMSFLIFVSLMYANFFRNIIRA